MAKLLCMEVGTSTVRLAEVVKKGKSVEIVKTHVFDTPDDATKDGKVRTSDEVIAAIREGIDESGIKATDVYFAVESTKILFKQVTIPLVQKRQIQTTLELSFSDHFPVDEKLYHLSYVVGKKYEKDGQKLMDLDVFAIPNDLSESYYTLAVSLGLNAKGLTDTSRGMISLFPSSFKDRNVAMININENVSTLTISVDGDMVFNKTIPYGVSNTIRHVMNSSLTMDNIDVTGAIELLYDRNVILRQMPEGIADENNEEEKIRYNVTTSLASLAKSIESTFAAFLVKEKIQVQEFQLSGLGAGFAGISQLLTSVFGLPVTVVQLGDNLKINPAVADDPLLLSCYPCVGAAIDDANFFTIDEKRGGEIAHNRQVDKIFIFVGALCCLTAFAYGAYSWLHAGLEQQKVYDENVRLTKRVQELRDLGVEIAYNNYVTAISYNEEVANLYNETKSGNEDMTVFLAELEGLLPTTARVSSMTLSPKTANVSFVCEDKFVAAGVLHLLRNMDTINNMECANVAEIEKTGEIVFTATFSLKSTAEREEENENQDDGNPDDELPPEEEKLMVESTKPNMQEDISSITVGEFTSTFDSLLISDLNSIGFNATEELFSIKNDALILNGTVYQNAEQVKIDITEAGGGFINGLVAHTTDVTFYKGISVGITMGDALALIGNEELHETNGYIILKNDTHSLVLVADAEDIFIDTIYLINNDIFNHQDSEIELPDAEDMKPFEPSEPMVPELETP